MTPIWHGQGAAAGEEYGYSVATAGDVNGDGYSDLIVGARHYSNGQTYEGAAYLYLGSADGLGSDPAWFVESNQSGAAFGVCVAPAGDVNDDGYDDVIIGADIYDLGQFDEGVAFVYLGSPTGLAAVPAWTGQADQSGAQYGLCVAPAGDVNGDGFDDVLVGAPFYDGVGADEGQAFLYLGTVSGVSASAAWSAGAGEAGAHFGRSVATAGDVNADGYADVIIGAERCDGVGTDSGAAWIYTGSPAGLTPVWGVSGEQAGDHLGWCVATAGDVDGDGYADVVIGAPEADSPQGLTDEGRAYVFRGAADGPSYTPLFAVSGGQAGAHYGYSVAPAGDTNGDGRADLIVGAWGYDGGQTDEGRAFLYEGPLWGIFADPVWTGEIDQTDARYGSSVATAGDVNGDGVSDVVVGTWGYDTPAANAGGAWVYAGRAEGLSESTGWGRAGVQEFELLGSDVTCVGDANGDGYSDVAVSAREWDDSGGGGTDVGCVWVHHGTPSGPATAADWMCVGEQAGSRFGTRVAPAGDVNGDGYSDLLVGATSFDLPGGESHGKVYLYEGSASGFAPTPAWTVTGEQPSMLLGGAIAGAGDVNGDGYADVILGSASYSNPEFFEGKAMLYLGSAAGLGDTPAWEVEGNLPSLCYGISVSTAGDVNGDGCSDVIVGAIGSNIPAPGHAYVYFGSDSGLAQTPAWTGSLGQTSDKFGISVSTAGDLNGDGYDDVVVGASMYDRDGYPQNSGAVAVYLGYSGGLQSDPEWFCWGAQADMHMGQRVCAAGDVNGDGYSDIGFSAPDWDGAGLDYGMAWVKQGSPTGPSGFPEWSLQGIQTFEACGSSLAGAGDASGDGFDDFIVGCPMYTSLGILGAGRALLFLGNDRTFEFGGFPIIARHQQPTQAPIDLLGRSESLEGFRLTAMGRSASGRARVRLEWRAAVPGVPLGSLAIQQGGWTMSEVPGPGVGSQVPLTATAGGFDQDVVCHWHLRIGCRSPFFPVTPWMSTPRTVPSQHQVRTGQAVSAVAAAGPMGGLRLEVARPNPFTDRTAMAYTLGAAAPVRLSVHDIAGRCVRVLVDEREKPGRHVAHWDGRDAGGRCLGAGLYFARIEVGGEVSTARLVRSR